MVAGVDQTMVMQVEKKDDNRKSNKPIMERRRRARINNCLNELKAIILDAMKKDPASHSKLEKADILEMTVKHLGGLRSGPDRFRAGYRRCLTEVARFPGLETEFRKKLVRHLEGLVPGARPPVAPTPPSDVEDATVPSSTILISGYAGSGSEVHMVPTRLPNGDIALLLPYSISPTLGARPTLRTFGTILNQISHEPFSPDSSRGSPSPPNLAPLALERKTLEGELWRPW